MDSPTITDRLTGNLRNIQSSALAFIVTAVELAATSGLPEQQVHEQIERSYREAQMRAQQTQQQWQRQEQASFVGGPSTYPSTR